MKTHRRTAIAATTAALFLLTSGMAAAQGTAGANEIRVGVFNSLTGVYAFGGVPIQNAMKMALEEANQKGLPGGAKIRVIEGDTGSEKAQVINLVNQFAKRDQVSLIIGPTTSLEALAGAPVANDLQVPIIAIGSSNDILATGPWAFKVQAFAPDIMGFLGKQAVEKVGVKRLTVVYDQGSEGYISQAAALRDYMRNAGVKIVSEEKILASDSNFLALATKISDQETDAVFIAAPAELSANFFIQLRQAGLDPKVKFIGPSTLASQGFIKTGGKAVEGTLMVSDYSPSAVSPMNQAFIEGYKARYKVAPDNWAAMGYTIGQLAAQAIQNAGPNPDRKRIRDEIGKLNKVPVVIGSGTWSVNSARQPSYGGVLLTVKDGGFVAVQ